MVQMYHHYFIYSSNDAHLGYFCISATVSNTAVNLEVYIFFRVSVACFFGNIPKHTSSGITEL